jgi:site-specific recombinase XerD
MDTRLQISSGVIRMSLDQCIAAWIDAKANRSESAKTKKAYSDTLYQFRSLLQSSGLDLDSDPAIVAPLAQGYAGYSVKKKRVTPATFNQRLAILSSFYTYAMRMDILISNPIDKVERRIAHTEDAAIHLKPDIVKDALASIDRSTIEGKRDYAILAVALETGRRVSEIASLTYGDIQKQGKTAKIIFKRCKGNKQMTDTLPISITNILFEYLYAIYDSDLYRLSKDAPVWVAFSDRCKGKAITPRTIQRICEKYLGTSKAHVTRHTWAVQMSKNGASLQQIQKGLGHTNLATTSRYMDEQLGYENPYAESLADVWGIK